jgi:hypothetical protein
MKYRIATAVLIISLLSCQSEGGKTPRKGPEEVLREYQGLVDKNKLQKAKALSTEAGKAWLDELAEIIASEQPDSTLFQTEFLSMDCRGEGDTLICHCLLEDQYERYSSDYILVKKEGQWLVDAPKDEVQIDDDVLEDVPDSLIEEMLEEELIQ